MVAVNVLLSVILAGPFVLLFVPSLSQILDNPKWSWLAIFSVFAMTNTFDAGLAFLFVLLALLLLAHRAFWPLLTRTLFRMTDIGTKGRRGILMTVGLALLGWSGVHLPDLLKELVKALGKG